ncbi:Aste57867_14763 [Aphanomyces stellatus]|uniref:Aste57867_14763 protein n=1 Tax=Aphanomyces stellatus TaxID=120398 RepID=A0A485L396_9STRA|nr:hypothetical protein As57867_014708 [Aphanomyces stellatus]VFT91581.1 Aste57867_14763 [Aphanomyces stellatus]
MIRVAVFNFKMLPTRAFDRFSLQIAISGMSNQTDDEEVHVGPDGTFRPTPQQAEDLQLQLDEVEQELHQAAKYGLYLVEKNEELWQTIERLHVEHETAQTEWKGEMKTVERHLYAAQQERDAWRLCVIPLSLRIPLSSRKCHAVEDEVFQLQQSLTAAAAAQITMQMHRRGSELRRSPSSDFVGSRSVILQSPPSLDIDLDVLKQAVDDKDAQLRQALAREVDKDAYIKRLQQTKRDTLDIIQQMKTAAAMDVDVRRSMEARHAALVDRLSAVQMKLDESQDALQTRLEEESRLRDRIEDLQAELRSQGDDVDAQTSAIQSMRHKCARLEKELQAVSELAEAASTSATATDAFDRLESFFNLTALGIILEHQHRIAQEQLLEGSSRQTIARWFREAVASEVPYHAWHAWLTQRITGKPRRRFFAKGADVSPSSSLAKAIADFFDKYRHDKKSPKRSLESANPTPPYS